MTILVTGAAGFIGSSLCERLLERGFAVRGVDSFFPYYPREEKERNLARCRDYDSFEMQELDLAFDALQGVVDGVTAVFHLAGQAGVRASWGLDFGDYVNCNVLGTQRLLEVVRQRGNISSFVAASSSSVYGSAESLPTFEDYTIPCPISPYGVTKLASERLCVLYASQFAVPTVSLRYFTVYGPRQRPDMAFRRLIEANLTGSEFEVLGDGSQQRDFTFIDDVVSANLLALDAAGKTIPVGSVLNVGGNRTVSLADANSAIEQITGRKTKLKFSDFAVGDPLSTSASIQKIKELTTWSPVVDIMDGLKAQIYWQSENLRP